MQKTYLYLMVCVIGAMSLASCSEDSISPDAGGDGDGDSTTEVPLAQVAKPKPNPWLAQEEYSITHFNSAQTDAFSSAVKDGTFNIDLSKCQMTWSGPVNLSTMYQTRTWHWFNAYTYGLWPRQGQAGSYYRWL